MANGRILPFISSTATQEPAQAGVPPKTPSVKRMAAQLETIINELRAASSAVLNPRVDPSVVSDLQSRAGALQSQAFALSARIDAFGRGEGDAQSVQQDLNDLGSQTSAFSQAAVDAVSGVDRGLTVAGLKGVNGSKSLKLFGADPNTKMWWAFGVGAVVIVAGFGIWWMSRGKKPIRKFSGLPGALPAR